MRHPSLRIRLAGGTKLRLFLDVGAHTGETAEEALDPVYRFDRIVCFEPVASCRRELEQLDDPRVTVCGFGLWNRTCDHPIYDPGTVSGSVFRDKNENEASATCRFIRASDWFREHVGSEDLVFMKLNCEGAECDILDDLMDSGEISKSDCIMIDFDVRKIPSQRHRERQVLTRLAEKKVRYMLCEAVMRGPTHAARIRNWLRAAGADDDRWLFSTGRRIRYVLLPEARRRLRRLLRRSLPISFYEALVPIWRRRWWR